MYEFMTKSVAKPGVTAKALHHVKKMYSTIAKLSDADLQEGHYDRLFIHNHTTLKILISCSGFMVFGPTIIRSSTTPWKSPTKVM